jgi:hypothetical protein
MSGRYIDAFASGTEGEREMWGAVGVDRRDVGAGSAKVLRATRRGPVLLRLAAAVVLAGAILTPFTPVPVRAAGPCDPPVNPIVCENSKPGNPSSEWEVAGAGDSSIQGFATNISVNKGDTVSFKVNTPSSDYRFDIYRLGYYGGLGARRVATIQPTAPPDSQPACLSQSATGLVDCGNWSVSAAWAVPADAVSGIYIARAVREDGSNAGKAGHIPFIVRDDSGGAPILFQTADTTWQAYNSYGGNSLYVGGPVGRAYKVSYNRPFNTRATQGGPQESYLFNSEYPMLRWLERNGYNVSYTTGVDSDRRGAEILEHRTFLSVGHDEYWSGAQRTNVENARNAGVNLAFFSANEVFWKTRWENSIDGSGTPHRTLVSYKETHANAKIDPQQNVWTGTWRDPRFSPPADGGKPENALTGTIFMVNGIRNDTITVPAADGKMRFWRNTAVAALGAGQTATLTSGSLGYEWDEDLDNGFRPAGAFRLSSTTVDINGQYLLDYGSSYGAGIARHSLVQYRHSSGALVFGAGTVQWPWGLDGTHDRAGPAPHVDMQQATVNLFADMGVQPGTLQAGLVATTASTDAVAPASTIASPSSGATVQSGVPVTIIGTSSDAAGQVGGIEVSTDDGATWHPATGRSTWSYTWTPAAPGSTTINSRATDDSGNIETPGAGVPVTVALPTGPLTVTFDDLGPGGQNLVGQYPSGVINWGTTAWYLSGAFGQFTTPNISFPNSGPTSATFTFMTPRRLVSIRAYNGGGGSSTVSLSCSGNTTKTQAVAAGQAPTITTGWSSPCTTVTVGSSNGWDTNFDTLIHDSGVADTTPPAFSAVTASNITTSSATITWTTSEDADSQVEYGPTTSYGSSTTLKPAMVTSHSVPLNGLSPSTTYHYRVKSRDEAGNLGTSADFTFTTAASDVTPPVISNVVANPSSNSATITWATNEASDTQVEYGLTTAYGSTTTLNPAPVTNHSAPLSGLAVSTTYHYRVKSSDVAGNPSTSGDFAFTTTAAAPQTVTFDDKPGQDQLLNGQYPSGVINWGTSNWYHSGPWGALTTKSVSFEDAGVNSRSFTFINPRRLISVQAYNGGAATSTLTLACAGQPNKVTSSPVGAVTTITTGWTGTCTTVTVTSSNGWDTNLDTLVHDGG